MNDNVIADGKYVEVIYKVIDQLSGGVLTQVEFRSDTYTAQTRYWRPR